MATIDVKDAGGVTRTIQQPNANGRAADAASRPVALSDEDVAILEGVALESGGNLDDIAAAVAATASTGATAAKQDTGNTSLASVDTKLSSQATAAKQDTAQTTLSSIDTKLTSQATAAKQDTGNTSLASVDTKLSSQATAAKQDTGNASIATIAGAVSGSKMATTQADGDQATIGAKADASAGADTGTFSLMAFIKWIASKIKAVGQATMANSHPVTIASDQTAVKVKAGVFSVSANFTRPADTTTYAVGDAISNATSSPAAMSWAIGSNGQTAVIRKVSIMSTQKGSPLLLANLWLFKSLASATFNDNATLDVDNTNFITAGAVIPCVETAFVASRARSMATGLNIPVVLDSSGNIAGTLQALNAYVPANGEVLTVILEGELQ